MKTTTFLWLSIISLYFLLIARSSTSIKHALAPRNSLDLGPWERNRFFSHYLLAFEQNFNNPFWLTSSRSGFKASQIFLPHVQSLKCTASLHCLNKNCRLNCVKNPRNPRFGLKSYYLYPHCLWIHPSLLFSTLPDEDGEIGSEPFFDDELSPDGLQNNLKIPLQGWEDLLEEEVKSWDGDDEMPAKIINGTAKIKNPEMFEERIRQARDFTQQEDGPPKPKYLPKLWIIRPKKGAYCDLMKNDLPRINSLVRRIRQSYGPKKLQILNVTMEIDMPLCEIFFSGSTTEDIRIFHARGGTLQAECMPRFWRHCDILDKEPRLLNKYGGGACPGLFPFWDEQGMMEEIDDCMNQPDIHSQIYRMNWGWHNAGALTPENEQERVWWYQNVHWPTRQAVQKAFVDGIEDFRDIILEEYRQLIESDYNKAAERYEREQAAAYQREGYN